MSDLLDQLQPIAELVRESGVRAAYSDSTWFNGDYVAAWTVTIDGAYKGAKVNITEIAPTLDAAAGTALAKLKGAFGLR